MGIWDSLRSLFGSKFRLGGPWIEGQYVTYVIDRAGDKQFVRLSLGTRTSEGWQVMVETKLGLVQTAAVLLAPDPGEKTFKNHPIFPTGQSTLFGEDSIASDDGNFMYDPLSHATAAMNMLLIQSFETIEETVKKGATILPLPIGELAVIELRDPWPEFDYVKIHHLSERIPITCLARTIIEGSSFSQTLTSYGCNNPAVHSGAEMAYLDFDNLHEMDHGSFSMTYPGTWFFGANLADQLNGQREWSELYVSMNGGNTAALTLCVSLFNGDQDSVSLRMAEELEVRQEAIRQSEELTLRSESEEANGTSWVVDFADPWKLGVRFEKHRLSISGETLAVLTAFLVSSRVNPLTEKNINNAEGIIPKIFESFRLKE